MKTHRQNTTRNDEEGYALIVFLILMALGAVAMSGSLEMTASDLRTMHAVQQRSERYYEAESGLSIATSWLRDNSELMLEPFLRDNFYTSFDTGTLSVGANDSDFTAPSKVKLSGTSNSALLTNRTDLDPGSCLSEQLGNFRATLVENQRNPHGVSLLCQRIESFSLTRASFC